jgi:hypothetical protein
MYCTGIFLEGVRRNTGKDLIQIAVSGQSLKTGLPD